MDISTFKYQAVDKRSVGFCEALVKLPLKLRDCGTGKVLHSWSQALLPSLHNLYLVQQRHMSEV